MCGARAQERRLEMIKKAAGERARGAVLENGCGVGMYLKRLSPEAAFAVGLEIETAARPGKPPRRKLWY